MRKLSRSGTRLYRIRVEYKARWSDNDSWRIEYCGPYQQLSVAKGLVTRFGGLNYIAEIEATSTDWGPIEDTYS